jgi:hypothetical protein
LGTYVSKYSEKSTETRKNGKIHQKIHRFRKKYGLSKIITLNFPIFTQIRNKTPKNSYKPAKTPRSRKQLHRKKDKVGQNYQKIQNKHRIPKNQQKILQSLQKHPTGPNTTKNAFNVLIAGKLGKK